MKIMNFINLYIIRRPYTVFSRIIANFVNNSDIGFENQPASSVLHVPSNINLNQSQRTFVLIQVNVATGNIQNLEKQRLMMLRNAFPSPTYMSLPYIIFLNLISYAGDGNQRPQTS